MSVIVKGMEMPNKCCECNIRYEMFCPLLHRFIADEGRRHNCPLGDVPTPHGRLGDLDELHNHLNEWYLTHEHGFSETEKIYIRAMLSGVKDSPTVIPESKDG